MITDMLAKLWTFDRDEITIPCGIAPIYVYIESDGGPLGSMECYYAIDHAGHTEFARTLNDAASIVNRIVADYPLAA